METTALTAKNSIAVRFLSLGDRVHTQVSEEEEEKEIIVTISSITLHQTLFTQMVLTWYHFNNAFTYILTVISKYI